MYISSTMNTLVINSSRIGYFQVWFTSVFGKCLMFRLLMFMRREPGKVNINEKEMNGGTGREWMNKGSLSRTFLFGMSKGSEGGIEDRRGLSLFLLTPFVLLADLFLFGSRKIVLDVERLPDLLGRLSLDHIRNRFAGNIKKTFGVEVIGGQN